MQIDTVLTRSLPRNGSPPTGATVPPDPCGAHIRAALSTALRRDVPYRHWLLSDVLPDTTARLVAGLPLDVPSVADTAGRRETHNASRIFFGPEEQRRFPVVATVAAAFQHPCMIALLSAMTAVDFAGTHLRIEYCQDTQGFWLEPHTDIGAKTLTLLVYLSSEAESGAWGTDIYASPDGPPIGRVPAAFDSGLMFVPGADTWHGFEPREIQGVRRSLIINFVSSDWRARHELAFPDRPVG
jgi:hypothetical protein